MNFKIYKSFLDEKNQKIYISKVIIQKWLVIKYDLDKVKKILNHTYLAKKQWNEKSKKI